MSLKLDLNGKRALVSGVSSGIGAGVAKMLAKAGCDVYGCGIEGKDSIGAQEFIDSVEKECRKAAYLSMDIRNRIEIAEWVQSAESILGGIDIVISNAGKNIFAGINDGTEDDWEENINLNLASHWRLAKLAYPYLKKGGHGVIVIMSSNHGYSTMPGSFPYNVAKGALNSMVQSIAIEWGPNIRAVGIAPGFIDTPAGKNWFETFEDPTEKLALTKASHPVNRIGSVEEIGALCAFLSSEYGGFINGTTILVDGGRSALMEDGIGYGKK